MEHDPEHDSKEQPEERIITVVFLVLAAEDEKKAGSPIEVILLFVETVLLLVELLKL